MALLTEYASFFVSPFGEQSVGRCVEAGAYNALKTAPDKSGWVERKTIIAQRVRDEHGLDMAISAETLDILEAALYDAPQPAYQPPIQREQPQVPAQTMPAPVYAAPSSVYAAPENTAAFPAPAKRHIRRNVLIAAGVLAAVSLDVYSALMYHPVKLDDYNNIILTQVKNNDELVKGNFALTLRNVKATQKLIKEKFPGFDFEEEGYITDDYRNELLVKKFNTNPQVLSIYLNGNREMAGKSQVFASLGIFDNELLGYHFRIDQEFSDTSGFEYYSA